MHFDRINKLAEFLSFLALIVGVPLGVIDLHNRGKEEAESAQKERVDAAERVYQAVDARYTEFVKLCIDHPRLDCYSVPAPEPKPALNFAEQVQQKMLFTELTDVFEVAYVQYKKKDSNEEIQRLFDAQWAGWDTYIRKFLKRPSYLRAWYEIRDEYDEGLVKYMDSIAPPPK